MATNRSSEKTKTKIAESLRKLMIKKPLDKIKIREIVDDCGVNRQTFYYHFQDIYALVEWMYTHDATILLEKYAEEQDWHSTVKEILNYLEVHRLEIICVFDSKADVYFTQFIRESVKSAVRKEIDVLCEDVVVDEYYKNFVANFYSCGICGILDGWIRNNSSTRMSSNELLRMFDLTIAGNIRRTIIDCVDA